MNKDLVILAAGIGSRFGGLKQMAPMGPSGEFLIDYALFDAQWAGFTRAVCIIRHDIEKAFRETIGSRIESRMPIHYVYQELDALPTGFTVPKGRVKPWGTGHAIHLTRDTVTGPFAVINADDFYGREAYVNLSRFLDDTAADPTLYGMVGFLLRNTLSEHGTVTRGICDVGLNSQVRSIRETSGIGGGSQGPGGGLTGEEIVSMNMWGFKPSLFPQLEMLWRDFLQKSGREEKTEIYIPVVVNQLIAEERARVRVLPNSGRWIGVTNPQDRESVAAGLKALVDSGEYPSPLWG
jgi:NDP-sugar pyrophosphorylase family protein